MHHQPQPIDLLSELFDKQKCWLIHDIASILGYAVISVRRFLKQIGYYRSFSHNGKWYTLHSIPVFSREGFWFYQDIGFSKHGNLTQTIVYLINKSQQGLTAKELGDKLNFSCHAVLTGMYKENLIDRAKFGAGFSYLSIDDRICSRQKHRAQIQVIKKPLEILSAEAAVFVLVEFIKDPHVSLQEIATKVRKNRNITVLPEDILRFFEQHGIKKTPDSSISRS